MSEAVRRDESREPGARRVRAIARTAVLVALVLAQSGCGAMWSSLRERERIYAINAARTQTAQGQCTEALESLDRAQARLDVGLYGREATVARARCYDKLGYTELAAAHRRLLNDFYTDEPMALPDADGSSVFRVKSVPAHDYEPPPGWMRIPIPNYSGYARRSKITGRVVLSFELARDGLPKKIRVLEMPHPLLATWAIEAIATARKARPKAGQAQTVLPGGHYLSTFIFESRWTREEDDDEETGS